jgi:hypothetical protein
MATNQKHRLERLEARAAQKEDAFNLIYPDGEGCYKLAIELRNTPSTRADANILRKQQIKTSAAQFGFS